MTNLGWLLDASTQNIYLCTNPSIGTASFYITVSHTKLMVKSADDSVQPRYASARELVKRWV